MFERGFCLIKIFKIFIGDIRSNTVYNLQSMCEESDIKEMGIPMGPRKKLQGFIKLHKTRKVRTVNTIRYFLSLE